MSVWVNGEWRMYDPSWSREFCDYVDRLRAEGLKYEMPCPKCGMKHYDPHIKPCDPEARYRP